MKCGHHLREPLRRTRRPWQLARPGLSPKCKSVGAFTSGADAKKLQAVLGETRMRQGFVLRGQRDDLVLTSDPPGLERCADRGAVCGVPEYLAVPGARENRRRQ